MYRLKEIQDNFRGLIGWRQTLDPDEDKHLTGFTTSETGYYYQDAHPLITLRNIAAAMDPEYFSDTSKTEGERLTEYLGRLVDVATSDVIQRFIVQKNLKLETRPFVDHYRLTNSLGSINATVNKNNRIVGIRIAVKARPGVSVELKKILLQMYGEPGTVKMYLFKANEATPVATFDVQSPGNGYLAYVDSPFALKPGAMYYLCYYENELPFLMRGISVNKDWAAEPCQTCGNDDINAWRRLNSFASFMPFYAAPPEGFTELPRIFDRGSVVSTNVINYGINAEISVGCDLTDFIIDSRKLFVPALLKRVGLEVLNLLKLNPDNNVSRNILNANFGDISFETHGSAQSKGLSLWEDYLKALQSIEINTRGLDRDCLNCKGSGIKYVAV